MSTLEVKAIQAPSGYKLAMPAGHILQVVQGDFATQINTSSTSYIDLGLDASITPSSTSSKIWIMYDVLYLIPTDNRGCGTRLKRDSTAITSSEQHEFFHNGAGQLRAKATYHYLDSPSSTSSINYSVQVRVYNGEIKFCNDGHPVRITLMEVAG